MSIITAARINAVPAAVTLVLAVSAIMVMARAGAGGDYLPLAMIGAAVLVLPALALGHRALIWDGRFAFAAGVVLIIAQTAVFRIRDIDDKSIDAQILMKLGAIGMLGLLAATILLRLRIQRQSQDFMIWSLLLIYNMFTSTFAVRPDLSVVETVSHVAAFFFLYGVARRLGRINLVNMMIASCFVLCLMSIVAYIADPMLGRMSDWVNGAFVPTSRLQGVFGTANAAGGAAAAGIILTLFSSDIPKMRPHFFALMAAFLICLALSDNRMAMAGLGVASLYVYLRKGNFGLKIAIGGLAVGLVFLAYIAFGQELLEALSRSGSADEITSGTGRTRIWSVVLQMCAEQPIFGYGAGSAKFILPKNPLLFSAAAHAHDLYLNILFSGGVIALGLFFFGLFRALRGAIARHNDGAVSLLIFFIVYGITEPTLDGLVSYVPMAFYAAVILAMPQRRALVPQPTSAEYAPPEEEIEFRAAA